MQLKILITTPEGQAKGTAGKLKAYILGAHAIGQETYVNKNDSQILWIIECQDSRRAQKITKNVARFDIVMRKTLENKIVRKVARLSEEQRKELDEMLLNQTQVSLVTGQMHANLMNGFIKV